MKKISLKKLFDNDRFLQVFAVVAAALCWLLVAMTQSYTTTAIIRNVPVKIDAQSSVLTSIGLHPINSEEYVDIEVEGLRSVVGRLKPEDFSISARLTGVTEAATYDLPLTSVSQSTSRDYQIKSYSPSMVRVRFDHIEKRTFSVKEQINGLAIASGYTAKTPVVTPDTVNIEGPAAELDKISKCGFTAELVNPLDRTYREDFPIVLYDANGNELNPSDMHLTMDRTEASLTIQVLKIAHVRLKVEFTTPPRGFPIDELMDRTNISQYDVTLAAPAELIDKISEIHLGYIDIKNITPSISDFSFPVPLPSPEDQYMRLDNVTTVVATVYTNDLDTAVFNVSDIRIINAPVGFDVETLAKSIPNVEFVGESEELASMSASNIVAEIDLSERLIESGSYNFPVKISVPGKGLVWAVGDHSVTIQVTETNAE